MPRELVSVEPPLVQTNLLKNHNQLLSVLVIVSHSVFFFLQSDSFLKDNNNAAQRLLDGVKFISQSVSELSVTPAKAVTSWLTDQIAPPYWKPNSLILVRSCSVQQPCSLWAKRLNALSFSILWQKCHKCSQEFQPNTTKHHCRACGEGFCDACSSKSRPVPERGWGPAPVRVCDACFHNPEIPPGTQETLKNVQSQSWGGGVLLVFHLHPSCCSWLDHT